MDIMPKKALSMICYFSIFHFQFSFVLSLLFEKTKTVSRNQDYFWNSIYLDSS